MPNQETFGPGRRLLLKSNMMQYFLQMRDGSSHTVGEGMMPIECFRCGVCCTLYRPRVSRDEIEHISQKLSLTTPAFISKYIRATPEKDVFLLQNEEAKCPFFSWDKQINRAACTIHSFRPQACRNWLASLSRPECREGLAKIGTADTILLPDKIYTSENERDKLSSSLKNTAGTP